MTSRSLLSARTTARLGGSMRFWRFRQRIINLSFRLRRWSFRLRLSSESAHGGTGAAIAVGRTAVGAIVASALLVCLLYVTERWRLSFLEAVHLDASWIGRIAAREPNAAAYDAALAAIVSIGGLFLGLYFAVVSGVVGGVMALSIE